MNITPTTFVTHALDGAIITEIDFQLSVYAPGAGLTNFLTKLPSLFC
jgi:hypothetical protein